MLWSWSTQKLTAKWQSIGWSEPNPSLDRWGTHSPRKLRICQGHTLSVHAGVSHLHGLLQYVTCSLEPYFFFLSAIKQGGWRRRDLFRKPISRAEQDSWWPHMSPLTPHDLFSPGTDLLGTKVRGFNRSTGDLWV